MKIGIPKEIKNNENRVAITPAGVSQMISNGHSILLEKGAGTGSGFTDEEFERTGAELTEDISRVWKSDMVLKVKEPLPSEYQYFHENLTLFTYLHLAPEPELTKALLDKGVTALAYETVQLPDNSLPLLAPMSEVAGRMSVQVGAHFLEKPNNGSGILLGGVPGVKRSKVVIIGGGTAGTNAAKMALGLGADVTILDISAKRLAELEDLFGFSIHTIMSNLYNLENEIKDADLVIGAVLIPGAKAPKLVTENMVKQMRPGSVLVDIAIDQGGIFETTDRITTHDDPIYIKHGVTHYSVANMPGAVPITSTFALTNVTLPYAIQIANKGIKEATLENIALLKGINTIKGQVVIEELAKAHKHLPYKPVLEIL